jgi:hypothetical protein
MLAEERSSSNTMKLQSVQWQNHFTVLQCIAAKSNIQLRTQTFYLNNKADYLASVRN